MPIERESSALRQTNKIAKKNNQQTKNQKKKKKKQPKNTTSCGHCGVCCRIHEYIKQP